MVYQSWECFQIADTSPRADTHYRMSFPVSRKCTSVSISDYLRYPTLRRRVCPSVLPFNLASPEAPTAQDDDNALHLSAVMVAREEQTPSICALTRNNARLWYLPLTLRISRELDRTPFCYRNRPPQAVASRFSHES